MCPHALRSRLGRGAILETVAVIVPTAIALASELRGFAADPFQPAYWWGGGLLVSNGPGCRSFARPPLTRMLTNEVISSLTICQVAQDVNYVPKRQLRKAWQ